MLRKYVIGVAVTLAVVVATTAARAKTPLSTAWDKGLRFKSEDGSFSLKAGGRIMNDWAWFSQDDEHLAAYGNWQDGTEYRRVRLYVSGTIYDYVVFKAQYDFANAALADKGEVAVKDMYIGVSRIPGLGTVRAGNQYEPFGLEEQTSSKYITFMERSLTSAFVPSRNSGIRQMGSYADGRVTFSTGIFRDTDEGGRDSGDGNYAGTARVTALPMYNKEDKQIVHVGAAFSQRNPGSEVGFDERPGAHLADKAIETPDIATDAVTLFGAEGAVVVGPFSAQGEYMMASLDAEAANDPSFAAFYVYGSFFLTGESRGYKSSDGLFDRVKPKKNFREDGDGVGAVELAVRYAMLDLNDQMIYGGELTDITVGLNWYLNPNARVMLNYVRTETKEVGDPAADLGAANIFQTRFQIDF